jgi:hypothetical protein
MIKKIAEFKVDWDSLARGFALGGLGGLGWMGANKLGGQALESVFHPDVNDDIVVYYDSEQVEDEDEDKPINYKYANEKNPAGYTLGIGSRLYNYFAGDPVDPGPKSVMKTSPLGSGFWGAVGAIPGVYAAIKGVQVLEGIVQKREFAAAIKDIERDINRGKEEDQEKKAFERKIYKFAVLKEYVAGFNSSLEKEAAVNPEFKTKLAEVYQSQKKMLKAGLHDVGIVKQAMEKQALPQVIEIPWRIGTGILSHYGSIMGSLVPLGYLAGHNLAKFYWPLDEKKTPPRILFKEKKKKKKKGLVKKSVALPPVTTMTQLLGAGYLIDLVRRTMGTSIADQLAYQLYPNQDPFGFKRLEEKKKKPEQSPVLPDLGGGLVRAGPGQLLREGELEKALSNIGGAK